MAQVTSGLRSLFSSPMVYDFAQSLMGSHQFRGEFCKDFVRAKGGFRILDLGCGTADILNYLPDVDYDGYDISEEYIKAAKLRFGGKARFHQGILDVSSAENSKPYDVVLALGVLHHLDDDIAKLMLKTAYAALKPGGRFVSHDPVFTEGQNPIAKFLISKDRGQNVRTCALYKELFEGIFTNVKSSVRHRAWIPYSHCFVEAVR